MELHPASWEVLLLISIPDPAVSASAFQCLADKHGIEIPLIYNPLVIEEVKTTGVTWNISPDQPFLLQVVWTYCWHAYAAAPASNEKQQQQQQQQQEQQQQATIRQLCSIACTAWDLCVCDKQHIVPEHESKHEVQVAAGNSMTLVGFTIHATVRQQPCCQMGPSRLCA